VEFAVVAPLLILLLFGIIDFSRAIWTSNTAAHAAREGIRYAIVRGAESGRAATESDIEAFVRSRAPGMPETDVNVTTTWKPDNKPGSVIEVRVDIPFRPILPMLPDMPLTSTAEMVITF
jgi:Flp pilus assembly protein TadG